MSFIVKSHRGAQLGWGVGPQQTLRSDRRAVRRAVRLACQAVSEDAFRLVGRRALDLSPAGMLLESDVDAQLGDELIVSFRAPQSGLFIDTTARVVRVVAGRRPGDHGRCLGLRFEHLEPTLRSALGASLAGLPPPLPQRAARVDYAATIRGIAS